MENRESRPFNKRLYVIATWMQGVGLSGGDRIFIELSRRWASFFEIVFLISGEGWKICKREGLKHFSRRVWSSERWKHYGYSIDYFYRSVASFIHALCLDIKDEEVIYSSSDFWPDVIPALVLKARNRKTAWIAGFYLFTSAPWHKGSPYKGKKWLLGLCYWLSQRPAYWAVKHFADMVFVTSDPDVGYFLTKKRDRERVIVVRGGVDTRPAETYLTSGCVPSLEHKKYDACFVGRFHYQKGVLELVDIWKLVCAKFQTAKLAMIGDGPLVEDVRNKIQKNGLSQNIELKGYLDGVEKFEIFKQSKIILHPAIYDSGGMAAAEAMAWGLAGVSFDLTALQSYYPKGMLKAKTGDLNHFSKLISALLTDKELYLKTSKDAYELTRESWEWNIRADEILCQVKKLL